MKMTWWDKGQCLLQRAIGLRKKSTIMRKMGHVFTTHFLPHLTWFLMMFLLHVPALSLAQAFLCQDYVVTVKYYQSLEYSFPVSPTGLHFAPSQTLIFAIHKVPPTPDLCFLVPASLPVNVLEHTELRHVFPVIPHHSRMSYSLNITGRSSYTMQTTHSIIHKYVLIYADLYMEHVWFCQCAGKSLGVSGWLQ